MLCSIFVHLKGLRSKKVHARGKKQSRCHSQNNLKKDFPPLLQSKCYYMQMPRSSFSGTSPGSNHTSLVLCVTTRSFWKEEPRQVCAKRRMTLLSAAGCRVQNLVNLWNLASYQAGSNTRVGTCLWYAWTRRSMDDPASHALVSKHRHTWIKVSVLWYLLKTYECHWKEFCNVIFLLWKL